MDERTDVHAALEPVINQFQNIHNIFTSSMMEFYEEAMSLTCALTSKRITPNMWEMLEVMYTVFQGDGFDYFGDMMPVLINYITVDTQTFLSSPEYMGYMYNMCKTTLLERNPGDDCECHAAKLMEVIILQCRGMDIDTAITDFVELVLKRLTKATTSDLRTLCLQVIIAALFYNRTLLLDILEKIPNPGMQWILKQWIANIRRSFKGLHDKKLCVLGLVELLKMPDNAAVIEQSRQLLPATLHLFKGLKRAYAARDTDDSDDEGDTDEEGDSDEEGDNDEEGSLEAYTTTLDDEDIINEFQIFHDVMADIQNTNLPWYTQLTSHLSENQSNELTTLTQ